MESVISYTSVASLDTLQRVLVAVDFQIDWSVLTIRESQGELEQSSLPQGLFLARNTTLPRLQIEASPARRTNGLCVETEGMVSSPLLALLLESVLTQRHVS